MAQITIPDELFHYIQQYAQEMGKTQEEVVREALTDLVVIETSEQFNDVNVLLPLYDSAEEHQVLAQIGTRVGKALADHGTSIADEISRDRGE